MKIYDHPLSQEATVIEIDSSDEGKEFLNDVIDGFYKFGYIYTSASLGDNKKNVIYLDRRSLFHRDEDDVLCDLTIQLANMQAGPNASVVEISAALATASDNPALVEKLNSLPLEYFNSFTQEREAS